MTVNAQIEANAVLTAIGENWVLLKEHNLRAYNIAVRIVSHMKAARPQPNVSIPTTGQTKTKAGRPPKNGVTRESLLKGLEAKIAVYRAGGQRKAFSESERASAMRHLHANQEKIDSVVERAGSTDELMQLRDSNGAIAQALLEAIITDVERESVSPETRQLFELTDQFLYSISEPPHENSGLTTPVIDE